MARANLIAVLEVARQDTLAVDIGAIVAANVDEAAMGRIDLHHEMDAREIEIFFGQLEMGVPRPANQERVVAVECELGPRVGTGYDVERDAHGVVIRRDVRPGGRWRRQP